MAMQRFFEFFRRKNYGALWNNLFNFFHLRSSAMRVKPSQTYKKNNGFIWGRLFSSSSLMIECDNENEWLNVEYGCETFDIKAFFKRDCEAINKVSLKQVQVLKVLLVVG